jgi:hypothetical protein
MRQEHPAVRDSPDFKKLQSQLRRYVFPMSGAVPDFLQKAA